MMVPVDLTRQFVAQAANELARKIDEEILERLYGGRRKMKELFVSEEACQAWGKDWYEMLRLSFMMTGMNPDAMFTSVEAEGGRTYIQPEDATSTELVTVEIQASLLAKEGKRNLIHILKEAGVDPSHAFHTEKNDHTGTTLFVQEAPHKKRHPHLHVYAKKLTEKFYLSSVLGEIPHGDP